MNKEKINIIIIWFLALSLSLFLLFVIPGSVKGSMIVTAIFTVIAFSLQLFILIMVSKGKNGGYAIFTGTPMVLFTIIYVMIQFALCVIIGFISKVVTTKLALIINFLIFVVMCILIFSLNSIREYTQKLDLKDKN